MYAHQKLVAQLSSLEHSSGVTYSAQCSDRTLRDRMRYHTMMRKVKAAVDPNPLSCNWHVFLRINRPAALLRDPLALQKTISLL